MKKQIFVPALASLALAAGAQTVTTSQVIETLEGTFGVHAGERRNHIKGTCAVGSFTGTPEAARYSRSPLFSGRTIPVVARFSLAGGNPKAPDTARSPRGMALKFRLPTGGLHYIAMINTPVFGAAVPQTFIDNLIASRPNPATGKPDPEKIKAFRASHPDSKMQAEFLATNNPPASYANSSYWGIHTFKFINKEGKTTLVRWQFVPQDGEKRLSDAELASAGPNFLEQALIERTQKGPVQWDMMVSIGKPGDSETNPTVAWPDNRERFKAGTLTLTAAMNQKGHECERTNYDPMVMSDGVSPTDDPILRFRSPAYAASYSKRLAGN